MNEASMTINERAWTASSGLRDDRRLRFPEQAKSDLTRRARFVSK
jgi:hypothetical protein